MKIAFKKTEITPHLPVQLSGFGKLQVAYQVHDPLYARIFLFEKEGREILWVQLDLTAFDEYLLNLIAEKTGFAKEQMIVSASHTHSAPGGTMDTYQGLHAGLEENLGGVLNPEYCHRIASQIAQTVSDLKKELKPGKLAIYQGKVHGLGTDRHDPTLPADEDALILEWITDEKKALIVRLSCHPTVLNGDNLEVSADFPGAIEPEFPDYDMVAYVNGSCGDMSTRFTRKASNFEEWERFGKLAANQIKDIMKQETEIHEEFEMALKQNVFSLPVKKVDTVEEAWDKREKALQKVKEAEQNGVSGKELRLIQSFFEGTDNNYKSAKAFASFTELRMPVSALSLPKITIVFTPVELFSKLSNPMKKYGLEYVGYSNGYMGYMPDKNAYLNNFYEASSTPYAMGAGEWLMEEIAEWLNLK